MAIEKYFTKTFEVYRQVLSNESSVEVEQSSFLGHIQHTESDEANNQIGIAYTRAFTIWCPIDTNLMIGDRVQDEDGKEYNIKFIQKNDNGNNQHLEASAELDISEPLSI